MDVTTGSAASAATHMHIVDGTADDNAFPSELLRPGGLIGDVAEYINATAQTRNEPLAMLAGLALVAHLAARIITTATRLSTSLLVFGLAPSGGGKGRGMAVLREIMAELDAGLQLLRGGATAQGIEDKLLSDSPALLWLPDESQHLLRTFDDRTGYSPESIIKELTDVQATFSRRTRAGGRDGGAQRVAFPALTMFGAGIPSQIYNALNASMLEGGLFARLLLVDVGPGARRGWAPWEPVPETIIDQCRQWHAVISPVAPVDFDLKARGLPRAVPLDLWDDIQSDFERQRVEAYRNGEAAIESLCNRGAEKVARIALCHAASLHGPDVASVGIRSITFARGLVEHVHERMAVMAARHSHSDAFEDRVQRALAFIHRRQRATGFCVKRSELAEHLRTPKAELDRIIETLADREAVEAVQAEPTGKRGRLPVYYRAVTR